MQDRLDKGPPSATADIFPDLGLRTDVAVDPARRVFVNRNLRMDQIRQIGFDMDYTLAPYVKRAIEELSYRLTAERLVSKLGYPESILEVPYDEQFVLRGLVVDKRLGNIFKMDRHNHIGRVFHGRTELTKEERRQHYRNVKIRVTASRYHWLDTLFALPEAALYSGIIDHYEKELGVTKVAYQKLFDDIRNSIDTCHRDGSLKAIVKADLPSYITADPDLGPTLHKLRSAGKRLFVLTNSYWDYTNTVMSYLLDDRLAEYPRWINYFDLVLVGAQKPGFFTQNEPFFQVHPETGNVSVEAATRFDSRGVYQGGNIHTFERFAPGGESVLYVGDHIYGDIIRSKRDSLWRTALVIEELEHELARAREMMRAQSDLVELEDRRSALDHEITALKLRIVALERALESGELKPRFVTEFAQAKRASKMSLDRRRRDLRTVIERRELVSDQIDRAYNPYWGSVFKEGSEVSRFGTQVELYACIYTSRVSNLVSYSPTQYFRAPRHWMSHEKA